MSEPRAPADAQNFPVVAHGSIDASAPHPPSNGAPASSHTQPSDATQGAAEPTRPGMAQSRASQYNVAFGEVSWSTPPHTAVSLSASLTSPQAINRRPPPSQGSEAGNHPAAARPLSTTGRYLFNDARLSAATPHPFGTGRGGGSGNGNTFAAQLPNADGLSRFGGGRGLLPRGPVLYAVPPNAYYGNPQRDFTPAGRMPSSIHVEKRGVRANEPDPFAIDDRLKAAWRKHLRANGEGPVEDPGNGPGEDEGGDE